MAVALARCAAALALAPFVIVAVSIVAPTAPAGREVSLVHIMFMVVRHAPAACKSTRCGMLKAVSGSKLVFETRPWGPGGETGKHF